MPVEAEKTTIFALFDLLKNVNDSGIRKLAINLNSVLSAGKRPGSLYQTLGPRRAAGSHFRVFSEYPEDIISRLLFVSVNNCRESQHVEWALELGACIWYRNLWLWLHCVWLSQCWINLHKFHSPHAQLTRWRFLPFRLSVGDMIYGDLGEYFTNCFAEIRVDRTSNLKLMHWDLCYSVYQHPCGFMVKPFEWRTQEQRKMGHWGKCI